MDELMQVGFAPLAAVSTTKLKQLLLLKRFAEKLSQGDRPRFLMMHDAACDRLWFLL
ncbi:MAG: hypothetical protein SFY66_15805 [Oculatellaceae cyanobacterium bins.114]|nr:hypothetical protein [Oculatellaceae cyanobacterium bins.114]